MSRLSIVTQNNAQKTVEDLYKDLERRITASQPGLCPVDLAVLREMCSLPYRSRTAGKPD